MSRAYNKSIAAAKGALLMASDGLVVNILVPDHSRALMEFERLVSMLDGGGYNLAKSSRILMEITFPETGGKAFISLPSCQGNVATGFEVSTREDAVFAHLCKQ